MTISGPTEVNGQLPLILMGPEGGSEERKTDIQDSTAPVLPPMWKNGVDIDPKHMLYKTTEFVSLRPHKNSTESTVSAVQTLLFL